MLERLESRRLFAVSLIHGTLTVTGTSGKDDIVIEQRNLGSLSQPDFNIFVTINKVEAGHFAWEEVLLIHVDALAGDDTVNLTSANRAGYIEGGAGRDTLIGSVDNDTLVGGSHSDVLIGNEGADALSGGAGNDRLKSTDAANTIYDGNDTLAGGDGDDTLSGGGGADHFIGGRGSDTADYSARTENLLINLGAIKVPGVWPVQPGTAGAINLGQGTGYTAQPWPDFVPTLLYGSGFLEGDTIDADVENATGDSGNDVIWGSDAANILSGGAGNDQIYGGHGYDALYGNAGNDRLFAADRTDAMPRVVAEGFVEPHERIVGGEGRDYAMIDWSDTHDVVKIEKIETLPFLSE
jgi:Ca2+-binding RTX toxin-like protein